MKSIIFAVLLAISLMACGKNDTQTPADAAYHAALVKENEPAQPSRELIHIKDEYIQYVCIHGIVYWTTWHDYTPYIDHDTREPVRCEDFK